MRLRAILQRPVVVVPLSLVALSPATALSQPSTATGPRLGGAIEHTHVAHAQRAALPSVGDAPCLLFSPPLVCRVPRAISLVWDAALRPGGQWGRQALESVIREIEVCPISLFRARAHPPPGALGATTQALCGGASNPAAWLCVRPALRLTPSHLPPPPPPQSDPRVNQSHAPVIAGFCYGGGAALRFAATHPGEVSAVAVFYGSPIHNMGGLEGPVFGVYGSADTQFPAAVVDRFEADLRAASINARILRFKVRLYVCLCWLILLPETRGDCASRDFRSPCSSELFISVVAPPSPGAPVCRGSPTRS